MHLNMLNFLSKQKQYRYKMQISEFRTSGKSTKPSGKRTPSAHAASATWTVIFAQNRPI